MQLSPTLVNTIGYLGAVCTTVSFIPQLARVIALKSAREISYSMFLIFAAGSGLWLTYGIITRSTPVAVSNANTLLLSFSIFILKLRYDRNKDT